MEVTVYVVSETPGLEFKAVAFTTALLKLGQSFPRLCD